MLCDKHFSLCEEKIALNQIMSFVNGYAFKSSTYKDSGKYRIVTIKNVKDGVIDCGGCAYLDELPSKLKPECCLMKGDVLLSLTGNVGRVGIVSEENLLLNQRVAKLNPSEKSLLPYLYFYFRNEKVKKQMETLAKGTAQANLSPVETLKMTIPFCSMTLAFADSLRPLTDVITWNHSENKCLSLMRDLLLPKLLGGDIELR